MKKVILKFTSAKQLWAFQKIMKATAFEINLKDYTIICDCDETEINLARDTYKAQVEEHKSDFSFPA